MEESSRLKRRRSIVALFFTALGWLLPLSVLYIILHFLASKEVVFIFENFAVITFYYRIVCIGICLEMLRQYFNELFIFGTIRIIKISGIISLSTTRTSITYEDIRDLGVKQSILGRIFDYGNLMIGTAALDAHEIVFKELASPLEVATFVREKMDFYKPRAALAAGYLTNNE